MPWRLDVLVALPGALRMAYRSFRQSIGARFPLLAWPQGERTPRNVPLKTSLHH